MGNRIADKVSKFWETVYEMHLYPTKVEGLFKAFIITISWVGGIYFVQPEGAISSETATGVYLFSLALIMEYVVPLVVCKKNVKKLLPFVIVFISIIVAVSAFSIIVQHPIKGVVFDVLKIGTIIPQVIIWIDVILQLWIDSPKGGVVKAGTQLRDI
ncbi:MAG: hypothetical protein HDR30_00820 [Lachnospiraceae bacterium]|nr:hypothetical protein [Lachnospiraceae bacterium]